MRLVLPLLSILYFSLITQESKAQITLQRSDIGSPGSSVLVTYDTSTKVLSPGPSGNGNTWIFNNLAKSYWATLSLVEPNTLAEGSNFPNANLAVVYPTYTTYYQADNVSLLEVGQTGTFDNDFTSTAVLKWQAPLTQLVFPANQGQINNTNSDLYLKGTGPFFGERAIVDTIDLHRAFKREVSLDGSGSLSLGDTVYSDVIRMKQLETQIDSIRIFILGSWYDWNRPFTLVAGVKHVVYDTVITYTYWTKDNLLPVLEIKLDPQDTVQRIIYRNQNSLTSIVQTASGFVSTPYPNPASVQLKLAFGQVLARNTSLIVSDITGRLVTENYLLVGTSVAELDVTNWANGLYIFRLQSETGQTFSKGKFVVQH